MINAVIFDLDGTLVQTEKLKALSYARAAVELCPYQLKEEQVLEAFKMVVGLSRQEVAMKLVEQFDLAEAAGRRQEEFGVSTPWQAFIQVRLEYYREMLSDPAVIKNNQWPHNRALLEKARFEGCQLGLATMSGCQQANRVLDILELRPAFDFIATRDDVEWGKPDPEIYLLVSRTLQVEPGACLVVEDSPSGVQAALSAGMTVMAVATPYTREQLRESELLPQDQIASRPEEVENMFEELLQK